MVIASQLRSDRRWDESRDETVIGAGSVRRGGLTNSTCEAVRSFEVPTITQFNGETERLGMTTYEWAPADNKRGYSCWLARVPGGELLATETSYGMELGHSTIGVLARFKMPEVTWIIDLEIRLPAANLADAKFRAQRRYERLLIAGQVAVDAVNEFYDLTEDERLAGQVTVDPVNEFYDLTEDGRASRRAGHR